MARRLTPVLIVIALFLAACSGGAPSDPKEIVAQGLDKTGDLTSFHVSVAVTGSITESTTGTSIALDGTTFEGDVATSGSASLTFSVPTLLSLTGSVLVIDKDLYVKTSLTGAKWSHQAMPLPSPGPSASAPAASPGAKAMIAEVKKFLAKDGVVTKKLDDVTCGDRQCLHVQVTIPSSVMASMSSANPMPSLNPSDIFGESLVIDLQFDKEHLWLTSMSMNIDSAKVGTVGLTVTLSKFNEPVTVTAPPADQVQEGGFNLPGGLPGFPGMPSFPAMPGG